VSDLIRIDRTRSTLVITLARADKRNALTLDMYTAMTEALASASADREIRAVLFHGEGKAFSTGNDLQDFVTNPPDGEGHPVVRFLQAIRSFDKPLLAAVHGWCVGIGTTMLLHCDLVYAAADSRFKMPFTQLALVPEAASSLLVPNLVGHRIASELLLLGDAFDSAKAQQWGFVNEVLDDADAALARALERADELAALSPTSIRLSKQLLKRAQAQAVVDTMAEEVSHFAPLLKGPEFAEAAAAFFEKRKPDFSKF
jgi:enoyl-CoA hydratase/carnithine racemase